MAHSMRGRQFWNCKNTHQAVAIEHFSTSSDATRAVENKGYGPDMLIGAARICILIRRRQAVALHVMFNVKCTHQVVHEGSYSGPSRGKLL